MAPRSLPTPPPPEAPAWPRAGHRPRTAGAGRRWPASVLLAAALVLPGAAALVLPGAAALVLPGAAALVLPGAAAPAAASAVSADYAIIAGGLTVLEVRATLSLGPDRYRLSTRVRTSGIAALFAEGEQSSLAEGRFQGARPQPAHYRSEGVWRGIPRRVELDYAGAAPVARVLEPPDEAAREPVPEALRRGAVDALAALAVLSRTVAETGRCDAGLAVFDGRRRFQASMRTLGRDLLPPGGGAGFTGEALRCALEWRQDAGFGRDERAGAERAGAERAEGGERGRPRSGIAWLAPLVAGGPPVPVRAEFPSRWLGTIQLRLVASGGTPR